MYAGKNEIWISADRRTKLVYDPSDEKLKLTVNDVEVMSGHATDGMVLLGLDLTELGALNGALAGTVVASKSAVYDAQGKLFASSASPAAAGTTIADATAMTKQFNTVTGATGGAAGGAGVLLPVAAADEVVVVVNTDASNALKVYAVTGSQVNALGSTVAYLVTPGQTAIFVGRSAVLWYTAAATDTVTGLTASATELNYNDITTLGTGAASKAVVLDADGAYVGPTAATTKLSWNVTSDSTDGGTSVEPFVHNTTMTGIGGVGGRARFELDTAVALGSWANALKAQLQLTAPGKVTGLGSAFVSELILGSGCTEGNYAGVEIEIGMPTGALTGTKSAFMYLSTYGDDKATFDTGGYLFSLAGIAAGTDKLFEAQTKTGIAKTHSLRVNILGTDYFIPLHTDKVMGGS